MTSSSSSTHNAFGFLAGTIYGPQELMPKDMERFRPMNSEEKLIYRNQVDNSKGFGVNCDGCLSGRINKILPTTSEWDLAEIVPQYATSRINIPGNPFKFKDLLKANFQLVGGVMYYVTFAAIGTVDEVEVLYQAKVWAKVDSTLELKLIEIVRDKIAEDLRRELETFYATCVKPHARTRGSCKRSPRSNNSVIRVEPGHATYVELKPRELILGGFRIFSNEIQMENTGWKYARARRFASKKWKSFALADKIPYLMKAQKIFGEKHLRQC